MLILWGIMGVVQLIIYFNYKNIKKNIYLNSFGEILLSVIVGHDMILEKDEKDYFLINLPNGGYLKKYNFECFYALKSNMIFY